MKKSLFLLRVALGWLFLHAGVVKVLDPNWSAAGYLNSAKTFPALYHWFASPANIGWVNFVNEWGLVVVGLALVLGFKTKFAAIGAGFLTTLYYFPVLDFPYIGANSYLVDDHVIYILALAVIATTGAGKYWGLDKKAK